MKKIMCALLCAAFMMTFTACSQNNGSSSSGKSTTDSAGNMTVDTENVKEGSYDLSFTKRDSDSSYDESGAVTIKMEDSKATASDSSVSVDGAKVTIKKEGTYVISGSCKDGKIIVDADDKAKVQLVFNGLNLTSSGNAVTIKKADKVFVTLAKDSENSITDGSSYDEKIDDTAVDAAIFSKTDISFNGSGKLTVKGSYKHGIVSKDDLVFAGGNITVEAKSAALEGKDSIKVKDASLTVTAGTDAIRATNTEKTDSKGFVYINSGTLKLTSGNDGIQASSLIRVDGGSVTATSGSGAENGKTHSEGNFRMDRFSSSSDAADADSNKGLKAADNIIINGGTIEINSADDGIHSNNTASVKGGSVKIATGDDGIHADKSVAIDGGTVDVTKSYEGIEAGEITVNDGKISVVSSDDGFNAGGGNDGNAGRDPMAGDASKKLIFNGGYTYVDAQGDGIDSNGSIEVKGGTLLVSGPNNGGNGAIDSGTSATITGGTVIAIGSTGMAESLEGSGQCTLQSDIDSQNEGTSCAVVDSSGNVIASLNGTKLYSNVVVSTPALKTGETYKIICGGTVSGADDHGFASKGSVSGGTTVKEIKLDTENYSNGGNTMGGGRMGGGNMGGGDRMGGPMGGNGSMGGGPMDRGSANNNFSAN